MKSVLMSLVAMFISSVAHAQQYPNAGIWCEVTANDYGNAPEFFSGTACYNGFTVIQDDGKFDFFVLHEAAWTKSKRIEYVISQTGKCAIDGASNTEKCVSTVDGNENVLINVVDGNDVLGTHFTAYASVGDYLSKKNPYKMIRYAAPFKLGAVQQFVVTKGGGITNFNLATSEGRSELAKVVALIKKN